MASLSLHRQFELSNRKVIEHLLLLKSAKAHGKKLHENQTTPSPTSFASSSVTTTANIHRES